MESDEQWERRKNEKDESTSKENDTIEKKKFVIPSFEHVQQAKQNPTGGNLFRPSGALEEIVEQKEQQKENQKRKEPQKPSNNSNQTFSLKISSSSSSFVQLQTSEGPIVTSSYFKSSAFVKASSIPKPPTPTPVVAPKPSPVPPKTYSETHVVVNPCQRGNRVLKYIKRVGWEFGNVLPDYVMGKETCALYLSLKYYLLHPDYIYKRIGQLKNQYRVRILICLVDIENSPKPLQELAKLSIIADYTLILAWSNEEVANYIETFKSYEFKSADMLKERAKEDFRGRVTDTLTAVRGVNKTDAAALLQNFGSLKQVINASMEDLSLCPGLGEKKVRRLWDTCHQPFQSKGSLKRNSSESSASLPSDEGPSLTFDLSKRKKLSSDSQ